MLSESFGWYSNTRQPRKFNSSSLSSFFQLFSSSSSSPPSPQFFISKSATEKRCWRNIKLWTSGVEKKNAQYCSSLINAGGDSNEREDTCEWFIDRWIKILVFDASIKLLMRGYCNWPKSLDAVIISIRRFILSQQQLNKSHGGLFLIQANVSCYTTWMANKSDTSNWNITALTVHTQIIMYWFIYYYVIHSSSV